MSTQQALDQATANGFFLALSMATAKGFKPGWEEMRTFLADIAHGNATAMPSEAEEFQKWEQHLGRPATPEEREQHLRQDQESRAEAQREDMTTANRVLRAVSG